MSFLRASADRCALAALSDAAEPWRLAAFTCIELPHIRTSHFRSPIGNRDAAYCPVR
jgi:hypothetical protein